MKVVYVVPVLNLIKLHATKTYGRGGVATYILASALDGRVTPGKELPLAIG
jgi:hypothetical protein